MGLILLIILFLIFLSIIPTWPYSRGWGYNPAIGIAIIFVIILILIFANVINFWGPRNAGNVNRTDINTQNYQFSPKTETNLRFNETNGTGTRSNAGRGGVNTRS